MNLDLFNTSNAADISTNSADAAATVDQTHGDVPNTILRLERVYRAEIALRDEVTRKEKEINEQLRGVGFQFYGSIDITGRSGGRMHRSHMVEYVDRVQSVAKHELSTDDAPFTADLKNHVERGNKLTQQLSYDNGTDREAAAYQALADHFSPVAMWRELYKSFDPEAQRRAACQAAASRIRTKFRLNRETPPDMKLVKGRIEVELSVSVTEPDWKGIRSLSESSWIGLLGQAFQQAMNFCGVESTFGAALTKLATELRPYGGRPVVSRERVDLGDGVDIVMGFQTFKLYLPQEIAGAVNLFLAEHPAPTQD